MTLPSRLAMTLLNSAFLRRHPAYVAASRCGRIREAGGAWHRYWHGEPVLDVPITRELPFLVGLLPAGPEADILPRVDLGFGAYADIYLLPDNELDWILLVDAGNLDLARYFQQVRNTTHLAQNREFASTKARRRLATRRTDGLSRSR